MGGGETKKRFWIPQAPSRSYDAQGGEHKMAKAENPPCRSKGTVPVVGVGSEDQLGNKQLHRKYRPRGSSIARLAGARGAPNQNNRKDAHRRRDKEQPRKGKKGHQKMNANTHARPG
eukprot:4789431-Karenia_brevis.AAC.1